MFVFSRILTPFLCVKFQEEFAVPEQFKTNFTGKGLKTVCSDSR
ncbi:unnamed protein product [Schistosoma mattheei]|uniref:Uncharacterized protein n=1 Tax=Schistosoma mattheei TaxID=31246 RepID=A0A183NHX8_9TREM|nr:unnamed protein product [Schistosoma mattheei]